MALRDYEISFLLDSSLHQFRFNGAQEQADEIHRALEEDLRDVSVMRKSDLQVYPVDNDDAGCAEHLVETVTSALCVDEDDQEEQQKIQALLALACRVDEQQSTNANVHPYLVEFIWNNGGGDDNPFSQGFMGDDADELTQELMTSLEEWLDEQDAAYDFGWGRAEEAHPVLPIEEAVKGVVEVLHADKIKTPALNATLQHGKLQKQTPRVSSTKARRTL